MTTIILGQHPAPLAVRLVRGDSATLVATLTDDAGATVPWPAVPTLQFAAGRTQDAIVDHVATVAEEYATWSLSAEQVEVIAYAIAEESDLSLAVRTASMDEERNRCLALPITHISAAWRLLRASCLSGVTNRAT